MESIAKKAILRTLIGDALVDLMVKTDADNVFLTEAVTVAAKIAEMVTAINQRAKKEEVTAEIAAAMDQLIDGAPATYDTLRELAEYIENHEDVVSTLNAAIGNKADQTTVTALQAAVNAIGALGKKDKVTENDLDESLKEKVLAAAEGNHSHQNLEVLNGISADRAQKWDLKSAVFATVAQPGNLASGDLWIQLEQ